jgi:ketosteroid isomerase-like protein
MRGHETIMPVQQQQPQTSAANGSYPDVERIYREWDEALSKNDPAALLALYAPDAVLESPLVPHLLNTTTGVCRGHQELKKLFDILATRKPPVRRFYRTGYFTDGHRLIWEYPHSTPDGEQMDFVEVMEIENGLIQKHRVYWGWFGFNVLKNDQYHQ